MSRARPNQASPPRQSVRTREDFYRDVLERLTAAEVPFLVGGAFAHSRVTGVTQRTKDLDLFVRPGDRDRLLAVMEEVGYRTELPYPHWLAKVHWRNELVDVIYSSGNGEAPVDDQWFAHSIAGEICGVAVRLVPVEEMIWTKAFIMERERFDGADVAHLLRSCAEEIDWQRLLGRFGSEWPVLLTHLVLYGYIYPGERRRIPRALVRELMDRLADEWDREPFDPKLCKGGLLSRSQYFPDLADWGYHDARVPPHGHMSSGEAEAWSAAAPVLPRAIRRRSDRSPQRTQRKDKGVTGDR